MAVDKLELDQGLGGVTWWGFSPWTSLPGNRALIIGAGDPRLLVRSLAEGEEGREFYILEQNIQVYCRQVSDYCREVCINIQWSDSAVDSPE